MRRVLVKLHRWIGVVLFAYVMMICLTGSFLVYRPELLRMTEPTPTEVAVGAKLLSDEDLLKAAERTFPDETAVQVWRGTKPNHAVEVDLEQGEERRNYLFDPYTGEPVGPTLPLSFRAITFTLDLHKELVGAETGRFVNGMLGLGLAFLGLTGVLLWKPRKKAERAGSLRRLHMTTGIVVAVFVVMWGVTGFHLAYPPVGEAIIEWFEPFDELNPVERTGDTVSYWMSYLHFGRLGGYVPGCERRDPCDNVIKVTWMLIALAPVFLAGSGFWLWLRGRRVRARVRDAAAPTVH